MQKINSFKNVFRIALSSILVLGMMAIMAVDAQANVVRREMTRLHSSMRTPLSTAKKARENPQEITEQSLERSISRIDTALRAVRKLQSTSPSGIGSVPAEEKDAYRAAYKERMIDFEALLLAFQEELRTVIATEIEERDFGRLGKIGAQVETCRDRSHSDFISPTPIADLNLDACRFLE